MTALAPVQVRVRSRGDVVPLLKLVRRDGELLVHGLNVGRLAERIAMELGLEAGYASRIRLAGLLHDIGKLAVPRAVLTKPGSLTDAERRVIERHPVIGASIMQLAGFVREARWIRHHHERVDGLGYPDRLAGDDIPLPSRIILAADAFDALTSDRPYRRKQSADEALVELAIHSGTQFDSACIDALAKVLHPY